MRFLERSPHRPRPIAVGGGRLASFLAGSAAFGSLVVALLVAVADLEGNSSDGSGCGARPAS